jgi:hypothetical protein
MARSIIPNNVRSDKSLERIAARLESRYDADTKHLRDYREDIQSIELLLKEGKIDRDHADIWRRKAHNRYEAIEQKILDKKLKDEGVTQAINYPFFYSFFKKLFRE